MYIYIYKLYIYIFIFIYLVIYFYLFLCRIMQVGDLLLYFLSFCCASLRCPWLSYMPGVLGRQHMAGQRDLEALSRGWRLDLLKIFYFSQWENQSIGESIGVICYIF